MRRAVQLVLSIVPVAIVLCALEMTARAAEAPSMTEARKTMVDEEIVGAGITNKRVIESLLATPRHEFVTIKDRPQAYYDMALPIGEGQTISPPFVVAYMTEQLDPQPTDKVLEIGTGSGYQAAVLSPLVKDVYSIEIVASLGHHAASVLKKLAYKNVHTKVGDGYLGWPENAPFDKIIVTCSPEKVPQPLVDQLREGGRLIVPLGERYQQTLYLFRKEKDKLVSEALRPTLFVPMTGAAESSREVMPDPLHPGIVNGGFEELLGDPPQPKGWHYARQIEIVEDTVAPVGTHYAVFKNSEPGRGSQALQAFGINGQKVKSLDVTLRVRANDVRPGQSLTQLPTLTITFYDERQNTLGEESVGPWHGTFGWQSESAKIKVPPKAAHAIVRLGLLGAVGEIAFDDLKIAASASSK